MIPVKPGTARRLGIRPPVPRAGLIVFAEPLSAAELAKFTRAFEEATRLPVRLVAPAFDAACTPSSLGERVRRMLQRQRIRL